MLRMLLACLHPAALRIVLAYASALATRGFVLISAAGAISHSSMRGVESSATMAPHVAVSTDDHCVQHITVVVSARGLQIVAAIIHHHQSFHLGYMPSLALMRGVVGGLEERWNHEKRVLRVFLLR